ncbi:MAG: hypothetical protein ACJAZP_001373 [Psychromonas sp.]|jgi:hypothetical protein|uniref:phage tail protein n=1 Tax=Psychromonas sp. TaxID=1884585 RepID=UPI0039E6C2CA
MSISFNPARRHDHAKILYKIFPAVYRERDKRGDLKKYLNGTGVVLNQLHNTLLQRYADIFADSDPAFELLSQPWLLPYIAQLLDVKLVSPFEQGKREEISRAVAWRKAKGTVPVLEQAAESVGQLEVVVQEGWKRVAVTARVGLPVLPLDSYGYSGNENYENNFESFLESRTPDLAPMWAKHPAIPAGTVDFRCQGGAVSADADNPAAVTSRVAGNTYRWRQSSVHGAQSCNTGHTVLPVGDSRIADWLPGYFDDPSVRTVDFRNPNWRQGHFHPRRVLLFTAPHSGFFEFVPPQRRFLWQQSLLENTDFLALVSIETRGSETIFRNKSLDEMLFKPIVIRLKVILEAAPELNVWTFSGFIFSHTIEINNGALKLQQCAVRTVIFHNAPNGRPVDLTADNCLFKRIEALKGHIQLQYCTVLTSTTAERVNASDSIFNGAVQKESVFGSLPGNGCIRFSALNPGQQRGALSLFKTYFTAAVFYSLEFGDAGCGVLHPACDQKLQNAAQDGTEIGAYHHLYLIAAQQAVLKKMQDFLPVGIKALLIPDHSLLQLPNEIKQ